ncbi:MAG: hypothetical protein ACI9UV_002175 [Algoriphagus sp.]|jgi:hypothetical protein
MIEFDKAKPCHYISNFLFPLVPVFLGILKNSISNFSLWHIYLLQSPFLKGIQIK